MYIDFIKSILKKASQIANDNFGKVVGVTKEKDNNQVLTETDIKIGNYIISQIKNNFPKHNIIDEEAGVINNDSQFTWVVDPIDGTSNFANGVPLYGVMFGLLDGCESVAGGVALPFFHEIYYAEKGGGAFCNDIKITVSKEENLLSSLLAYGIDGHQENPSYTYDECEMLADIVLNIRNLRASNSVFDLMMVAKGKYGGYLNKTTKIWDNVAPQIIIEEAGGIFTDFFGEKIDYSNPLSKANDNFTVCASSRKLHKEIQYIIHDTELEEELLLKDKKYLDSIKRVRADVKAGRVVDFEDLKKELHLT